MAGNGMQNLRSVGETYFFRDPEAFALLEMQILPRLFESRRGSRQSLRIWSAGCATGEEAYSIAILVHRMLKNPSGWNISIAGTDVNPEFLGKAEKAIYGEWSFRGVAPFLQETYFRRKGKQYELVPEIRRMVRFSKLNLLDGEYPVGPIDVILCRNVIMYFDADLVEPVLKRLSACLASDGVLMVGLSEGFSVPRAVFAPLFLPAAAFQRKRTEIQRAARPGAFKMELPHQQLSPLGMARKFADGGELKEALTWCERAIRVDKLNPDAHYLHSTILQELGEDDKAMAALRRVLYIDPENAVAQFSLSCLKKKRLRSS